MLKLFQVNIGRYICLNDEIPPTSRVSDLCQAVEAESGEVGEGVVMLTSEGQQMEPNELIGRYSVGIEGKPIFVFFRSYLQSSSPPVTVLSVKLRSDLSQQLQLLSHRPTPAHFQKQISLAVQLADYSVELESVCRTLCEEVRLQRLGWRTVLHNCKDIVRTYRKHQQYFQLALQDFTSAKPRYLQLLEEFPSQIELLHNLPVPMVTTPVDPPLSSEPTDHTSMASSLYDWISTHDERNNLLDLSSECQKALQQVESDLTKSALLTSEEIIASPIITSLEEADDEKGQERLDDMEKRSAELVQVQSSLAQNMQSTSQRALRSGDAGTLADLVVSHQSALVLMGEQSHQLELYAMEAEEAKQELTKHVHKQLQAVTQLQMKISESNSRLHFLHEHIKLAKKRFEVLEQVCSTPQVLASVLVEIDRRRSYNSSLQQYVQSVSTRLRDARSKEKEERKVFVGSQGHHFLLTLFPELQRRTVEVTCHVTESGDKVTPTPDSELEKLRALLPQQLRSSSSPSVTSTLFLEGGSSDDLEAQLEQLRNEFDREKALWMNEKSALEEKIQRERQHKEELSQSQKELQVGWEMERRKLTEQLEFTKSQNSVQVEKYVSENTGLLSQLHLLTEQLNGVQRSFEDSRAQVVSLEQSHSELSKASELLTSKVKELEETVSVLRSEKCQLKDELSLREQEVLEAESVHGVALKEAQYEMEKMMQKCVQLEKKLSCLQGELLQRDEHLTKSNREKEAAQEQLSLTTKQLASMEEVTRKAAIEKQGALESTQLELSLKGQEIVELREKLSKSEAQLTSRDLERSMHLQRLAELDEQGLQASERANLAMEKVKELEKMLSIAKVELVNAQDDTNKALMKVTLLEEEATKAHDRMEIAEANVCAAMEERVEREKELIERRDELLKNLERCKQVESCDVTQLTAQITEVKLQLEQLRSERDQLNEENKAYKVQTEELTRQLSEERDAHLKISMEMERELKDLRRQTEGSPPFPISLSPVPTSSPPSLGGLTEKVTLSGFHVGDLALFLTDRYKNYLALSVDGRIYYLNHACLPGFTQDISTKVSRVELKRKVLLGRITSRVLVEVRKEGNRLGVPVGERLYKVDAVEVIA